MGSGVYFEFAIFRAWMDQLDISPPLHISPVSKVDCKIFWHYQNFHFY